MVKKWLMYILGLLGLTYLTIMYNERALSVLWLFMILFPLVSWCNLRYSAKGGRIAVTGQNRTVTKGAELICCLQAELFPRLASGKLMLIVSSEKAYDGRERKQVISRGVFGAGTREIPVTIDTGSCKAVLLRITDAKLLDWTGLFSAKLTFSGEQLCFLVVPEVHYLERSPVRSNPNAESDAVIYSDKKPGDDPSELFGVREYRPGDKQNRIHWKLTAKQDEWIIRELGQPLDCSVCILVDIWKEENRNAKELYEGALETALSISATLMETGQLHYLAWYDAKAQSVRRIRVEKEEHIYEAMGALLRLLAYEKQKGVIPAYMEEYFSEKPSNLFYVSSEMTMRDKELLTGEKDSTYLVFFHIVSGRQEESAERKTEKNQYEEAVFSGIAEYPLCAQTLGKELQELGRLFGECL